MYLSFKVKRAFIFADDLFKLNSIKIESVVFQVPNKLKKTMTTILLLHINLVNLQIKVVSEVIHFVFKWKIRSCISFLITLIYWTSKGYGGDTSQDKLWMNAISFLIKKSFFTIANLQQEIGISTGKDPAPYWANLFLYFFKFKYI